MRFVFFYDRVVNVNQIIYLWKTREGINSPRFNMKLTDGTMLTVIAADGETEARHDKLLKNLQYPDLSRVYNLYTSDYDHPRG